MSISFGNNRVIDVTGFVVWTTNVCYWRKNAGKSQKWSGRQWHCSDSERFTTTRAALNRHYFVSGL